MKEDKAAVLKNRIEVLKAINLLDISSLRCLKKLELWTYLGAKVSNNIQTPHVQSVACRFNLLGGSQRVRLRPRPGDNALLRKRTFCIVLADRPYGSWKRTFFENGSQGGRRIWILSTTITPSPRPSTSHNNNNNNGGLHGRVRAAEDIEPFLQLTRLVVECESQQQFDLIIGPHKRFWFPCTRRFHLLLAVFSFSVYCLFVYSIFGECQAPPIGWNINYSVFGRFQRIRADANILETMPRKTEEKRSIQIDTFSCEVPSNSTNWRCVCVLKFRWPTN